ncbi:MAG TPA: hypothetical protein VMF52_18530 [Steroidobacteraceae bacterium]|nr:hypothetical protein [Steroidobacteraceae bacterium]
MKFWTALILSCAMGSLVACSSPSSDDARVRALIDDAEKAAESRDVGDVLDLVDAGYADAQGNSRDSLRGFLRVFFAAHPQLELVTSIDTLEFPVPGLARARVTVRGLDLDRFNVGDSVVLDVELRRDGDDWRVTRADRAAER